MTVQMTSLYLVAGLLGLVAAALAFALWNRRKWTRLQARFPDGLRADDVRMLLGSPSRIIETFPGPVAECWIYPRKTRFGGKPLGIALAVDLDGNGAVHDLRRVKSRSF